MAASDVDHHSTYWSDDASGAMFGVSAGGTCAYRLVVEPVGKGWEWIAWPVGDSVRVQCGRAATRQQAMQQAEAAVLGME